MTTVVYTDGACSGNPGPGGWAWAVPGGKFAAGPAAHTTNQRMEVQAVLEALRTLEGPVQVISDSTYVINCFRDRWWEGWIKRGWQTSAKKPVANRDLWEPLIDLVRSRNDVTFEWVKGHSGNAGNDLVDQLAVEAGKTQTLRTGDGAAIVVSPNKSSSGEAPAGHLLLVTGHRPPDIGGYGSNKTAGDIRNKLVEIISAKAKMHPELKVVTGLGLGAEQLGAEAAVKAGVPFVAVLPYPNQDAMWPADTKRSYADLLAQADAEVLLQTAAPTSKQAAGGALNRRSAWFARNVQEAVVVWNGVEPQLERVVNSLRDQLGEDEVWVVDVE